MQAETLRGEAVERAQCYIEERDAALAQVEALARAGMLAASALDGLLGDSDLPEDNRPGVLALRALIAALSNTPAPAGYTRELVQAACMDVWDDEVGTRRVLAALDAHPEEEKPETPKGLEPRQPVGRCVRCLRYVYVLAAFCDACESKRR